MNEFCKIKCAEESDTSQDYIYMGFGGRFSARVRIGWTNEEKSFIIKITVSTVFLRILPVRGDKTLWHAPQGG